jgi:sulfite reductase beta subunit-like hemoprotein
VRGSERGFTLWAGGGLGSQPFLAVPVAEWVPAADLLIWCEAIVRVQHRHGERKNRSRARMKYVVRKMGPARFRETVLAEVARVAVERGDELRGELAHWVDGYRVPAPAPAGPAVPARPGFAAWRRTNVRAQRQAGYAAVVVQLPLGDVTVDEMRGLAALVRRHGNGTLRATNDQNFVLPWIAEAALPAVHAALEDLGLGNPDAGTIADVVSCPGMDYCSLAITRSMGIAERVRDHLLADPATRDGFAAALGPFGIKVSGCPNSCGQHHVGEIGLTGHSVTDDDGVQRPYYSILVGGGVGEGQGRVGRRVGRFAEEVAPRAIVALARFYAAERQPDERFSAFIDRIGLARAAEVADASAKTS